MENSHQLQVTAKMHQSKAQKVLVSERAESKKCHVRSNGVIFKRQINENRLIQSFCVSRESRIIQSGAKGRHGPSITWLFVNNVDVAKCV